MNHFPLDRNGKGAIQKKVWETAQFSLTCEARTSLHSFGVLKSLTVPQDGLLLLLLHPTFLSAEQKLKGLYALLSRFCTKKISSASRGTSQGRQDTEETGVAWQKRAWLAQTRKRAKKTGDETMASFRTTNSITPSAFSWEQKYENVVDFDNARSSSSPRNFLQAVHLL